MNNDEFVNQIKSMVGNVKAEAYKAGFTDGMAFVTEPAENLVSAAEKIEQHVMSQIEDLYGRGKEYKITLEAIKAFVDDLKAGAFLEKPKPMSYYWDDEYGDDL